MSSGKEPESYSLVWTVWEAMGGFNTFKGNYWKWTTGERQIHTHGTWPLNSNAPGWGEFVDHVEGALFGP